ncbi:hypothetical protein D3C87_1754940 [compost metagenome]
MVPEPVSQSGMPIAPVLGQSGRHEGPFEVFGHLVAEEPSEAYGNIRISGEIEEDQDVKPHHEKQRGEGVQLS